MKILKMKTIIAFLLIFDFFSLISQDLIISDSSKFNIYMVPNILPLTIDMDKDGVGDIQINETISNNEGYCDNSCVTHYINASSFNDFLIFCNSVPDDVNPPFVNVKGLRSSDTLFRVSENWFKSELSHFLMYNLCTSNGYGMCSSMIGGYWNDSSIPLYFAVRKIALNDTLLGWIKIGIGKSYDANVYYAIEKGQNTNVKTIDCQFPNIYSTLTSDYIFISGISKSFSFLLYNNLGHVVKKGNLRLSEDRINIKDVQNGFYILKVANGKTQKSIKIIKN